MRCNNERLALIRRADIVALIGDELVDFLRQDLLIF
jgi:hypothetical protein